MIRSMPAFRVCVLAGQVPHAPTRVTWITPVASSTSSSSMSPPSACSAGLMIYAVAIGFTPIILASAGSRFFKPALLRPVQRQPGPSIK